MWEWCSWKVEWGEHQSPLQPVTVFSRRKRGGKKLEMWKTMLKAALRVKLAFAYWSMLSRLIDRHFFLQFWKAYARACAEQGTKNKEGKGEKGCCFAGFPGSEISERVSVSVTVRARKGVAIIALRTLHVSSHCSAILRTFPHFPIASKSEVFLRTLSARAATLAMCSFEDLVVVLWCPSQVHFQRWQITEKLQCRFLGHVVGGCFCCKTNKGLEVLRGFKRDWLTLPTPQKSCWNNLWHSKRTCTFTGSRIGRRRKGKGDLPKEVVLSCVSSNQ